MPARARGFESHLLRMPALTTNPGASQSTLKKPTPESEKETPVVIRREPEKELVVWMAPARPFKKRNRQFYVSLLSIAAITGLILFLIEGILPVVLIIALVFLFYVLSTVEPENIEYKVTTRGIKIAGKSTSWHFMFRFWFTRRIDTELLVIETANFPGRLELVVNSQEKNKVRENLLKYLDEEEAPPTFTDKAAGWFAKKLPGN